MNNWRYFSIEEPEDDDFIEVETRDGYFFKGWYVQGCSHIDTFVDTECETLVRAMDIKKWRYSEESDF